MNLIEKVAAQTIPSITVSEGSTNKSLSTFANSLISQILIVAGILAVIYLIYSGILYITAAGNPDQAKKGQQGVVNAIIGIIIIVLAYVIVGVTINTGNTIN